MGNLYAEDRKIGVDLAKKAGATQTAGLIEQSHVGFPEIFASAEKEIGRAALVKAILNGPPAWSAIAALQMRDLNDDDDTALAKRAAEVPAGKMSPGVATDLIEPDRSAALTAAVDMGAISSMSLHNAMAATVQWTVNWQNGGTEQPKTAYPDWNKWQWSGDITAGCSSEMTMQKITQKVPNAQIANGDTVWIYVWVAGGSDLSSKNSQFQFTYGSGSVAQAKWVASGTTTINQLGLQS